MNQVRPAVEGLLQAHPLGGPELLARRAVRAHIGACADRLRRESALVHRLITEDGLLLVGAEYDLETGVVEVLDAEDYRA